MEQVRELVHAFVRHHAELHTSARVVNYELAALSDDHLAGILDARHRIDALVRGAIERGVAAGAFRTEDPRMAAVMLLSLAIDVARWYRDEGDWSPERVADFYVVHVLRMLGASER